VASDETQTSGQLSEEPSDDLTRIPDLSPATGERLRRAGVRTYADLAASPPQEIARITRRSPQRVAELDWVGHARRLATGSPAGVDSAEATTEEDRQHYESFTVRLLLEDDNAVRRLSVKHTRTLHEEVWNGWEAAKLVDFIAEQADVRTESAPQSKPAATASALVSAPEAETPRRRTQLQVKEVEVVSSGGGHPDLMLHANEPFTVRLTIDLARLEMEGQAPLEYGASVIAKLPGRARRTVGEAQGKLDGGTSTEVIEVHSASDGLPAGIYELSIAVRFRDPATLQPLAFAALLDGEVLQVI